MSTESARSFAPVEVKRLDRQLKAGSVAVKKVDSDLPALPLEQAKAEFGAAVRYAVGEDPPRQYGDEGQMSNVFSGEKVPAYLGRIQANLPARRRLGIALLRGTGVRKRVTLEWDEEVG